MLIDEMNEIAQKYTEMHSSEYPDPNAVICIRKLLIELCEHSNLIYDEEKKSFVKK